jgi:hypothetical protein
MALPTHSILAISAVTAGSTMVSGSATTGMGRAVYSSRYKLPPKLEGRINRKGQP